MVNEYNLYWVNILDKIMMEWFKKHAPGLICVGNKPHPFVKNIYAIFCGKTTIICQAQIVEEKYRPHEFGPKYFSFIGKAVRLILNFLSQYLDWKIVF